jgi:hypothetical protein
MSDDGAHLGYGAEAAMRGALGDTETPKLMTTTEMREYIESAPETPDTYDDFGRLVAKYTLAFLDRHPEGSALSADSEYEWPGEAEGKPDWNATPTIKTEGLYDYMKRAEPEWFETARAAAFTEMTGFMWGWAVNAARRCLELPPVANPAIVTIGGSR